MRDNLVAVTNYLHLSGCVIVYYLIASFTTLQVVCSVKTIYLEKLCIVVGFVPKLENWISHFGKFEG